MFVDIYIVCAIGETEMQEMNCLNKNKIIPTAFNCWLRGQTEL